MPDATRKSEPIVPASLGALDVVCLAIFTVVLLLLSYLRSRARIFWSDEIMGSLVLRQPTWHQLLVLWDHGIDSSGIWFYVLGRPWMAVFGGSEVSFREFSAAGIAASAVVIWITARRYYSLVAVAGSIPFVYISSLVFTWQLANGRCYGLLMFAASLVVAMLVRGEDTSAAKPSSRFLLATFAVYALLCGSHILGALYCAGFLGMQVLLDRAAKRFRPTVYLSAGLSVALVAIFSRANLKATAALGKPSYWTIRPSIRGLFILHNVFDHHLLAAFAVLAMMVLFHLQLRRERRTVYVLVIGFALLDVAVFVYSRIFTSIYVDRYLLPFNLIGVLLLCELFTQVAETGATLPRLRSALPLVLLPVAAAIGFLPGARPALPLHDYTEALLARAQPGLPIVDAEGGTFVEEEFYHRDAVRDRLFFPVDWESALDPSNVGGVSGYHEMDNFKLTGLYADDIVPYRQLLDRLPDFTLITPLNGSPFFNRRIRNNPQYAVTDEGTFTDTQEGVHLWQVHRR